MVRVIWVISALLTLATDVLWFQNYSTIVEHGSVIRRAVVPALTLVVAALLFFSRGQLISGVRRPTDATPAALLSSSISLFVLMISGLYDLG